MSKDRGSLLIIQRLRKNWVFGWLSIGRLGWLQIDSGQREAIFRGDFKEWI